MKAIAVNGSPRKGWNTDLILQEALKGAADAGAETELIQVSDPRKCDVSKFKAVVRHPIKRKQK